MTGFVAQWHEAIEKSNTKGGSFAPRAPADTKLPPNKPGSHSTRINNLLSQRLSLERGVTGTLFCKAAIRT